MGRRKTRRTGADDRHLLIPSLNLGHRYVFNIHLVSHKALQGTDRNGLIHLAPPACGLTWMGANATYGPGKRQGPENDLHGFLVFALGNQRHIGVGVDMVGTTVGAGGSIALVDHISTGYGLGVRLVGGLPGTNTLVELTGHGHRTNLGTITAASAFVQVNVARLSLDRDLKAPHITGYILYLGKGK